MSKSKVQLLFIFCLPALQHNTTHALVSYKMPTYDYQDYNDNTEHEEEAERRYAWEVTSWILMALTLFLNLAVIFILLYRQNAYNVVNKGMFVKMAIYYFGGHVHAVINISLHCIFCIVLVSTINWRNLLKSSINWAHKRSLNDFMYVTSFTSVE